MELERIAEALRGLEGTKVGLDFEKCKIQVGEFIVELDGRLWISVTKEEEHQ